MKLIKGINNIRHKFNKPVLAIGMFDGVHLAHQRIIKAVVSQAKRSRGTSVILTFCPHPAKIIKGYWASPLITSVEHKIDLIRQLNVEVCLILNFDQELVTV